MREPDGIEGRILDYGASEVDQAYLMCKVFCAVDWPPPYPTLQTHTVVLKGTDAERRAQAEAIVAEMGATAGVRGGFYYASMPGTETLKVELYFAPPIPA